MGWFSSIIKAVTKVALKVNTFMSALTPIQSFLVSMAVSAVLSKVFAKKPKANYQQQLSARTEMVKQAIITRDTAYGETKKSGGLLFMEATNNNKDLHLVIQLASHEIQAIDAVYFGEEELTLASAGTDSNGLTQFKVTSPAKYSTESRFTNKKRTFILSNYVDVKITVTVPYFQLPFGGSGGGYNYIRNG